MYRLKVLELLVFKVSIQNNGNYCRSITSLHDCPKVETELLVNYWWGKVLFSYIHISGDEVLARPLS